MRWRELVGLPLRIGSLLKQERGFQLSIRYLMNGYYNGLHYLRSRGIVLFFARDTLDTTLFSS